MSASEAATTGSPSLSKKKNVFSSKRVIKPKAGDQPITEDSLINLEKTPPRFIAPPFPFTAPSKLERINLGSFDEKDEFDVWEDPELVDEEEEEKEEESPQDHEMVPQHVQDTDSLLNNNKENQIDSTATITGTAAAGTTNGVRLASTRPVVSETRSVFSLLPIAAFPEYQGLLEQEYEVSCSPKSLFNLKLGSKAQSVSKFPYSGLNYSKELPPPSKFTRTLGSEHYRVTSVNLFKKADASRNSTLSKIVMDTLSPTTPHRIPDHIHSSRVSHKKLFPISLTQRHVDLDGTDSLLMPKDALGDSTIQNEPSKLNADHGIATPAELPSKPGYNLRPRSRLQPCVSSSLSSSSSQSYVAGTSAGLNLVGQQVSSSLPCTESHFPPPLHSQGVRKKRDVRKTIGSFAH